MKYRTIVADPPWPQKGAGPLTGGEFFEGANGASRPMPYQTMTIADIAALEVPAEDDAHLYLWTTNGFLEDAFGIVRAWGFKRSTILTWAKAPMGGGLGGDAFGIASEFVIFARRGNLPALSRVGRNWFDWKRPYENGHPKHSAKPDAFYDLVEQVSPGPRLEMFARGSRDGWDVWGDEALHGTELVL